MTEQPASPSAVNTRQDELDGVLQHPAVNETTSEEEINEYGATLVKSVNDSSVVAMVYYRTATKVRPNLSSKTIEELQAITEHTGKRLSKAYIDKTWWLSRVKEIWGEAVIDHYRWRDKAHNSARHLARCAERWPIFDDFRPHATAMQFEEHLRGIKERNDPKSCASATAKLSDKTIYALFRLATTGLATEHGRTFVPETAEAVRADILRWTREDACSDKLFVGGRTLHSIKGYQSKYYLLEFDKHGLLRQRSGECAGVAARPMTGAHVRETSESPRMDCGSQAAAEDSDATCISVAVRSQQSSNEPSSRSLPDGTIRLGSVASSSTIVCRLGGADAGTVYPVESSMDQECDIDSPPVVDISVDEELFMSTRTDDNGILSEEAICRSNAEVLQCDRLEREPESGFVRTSERTSEPSPITEIDITTAHANSRAEPEYQRGTLGCLAESSGYSAFTETAPVAPGGDHVGVNRESIDHHLARLSSPHEYLIEAATDNEPCEANAEVGQTALHEGVDLSTATITSHESVMQYSQASQHAVRRSTATSPAASHTPLNFCIEDFVHTSPRSPCGPSWRTMDAANSTSPTTSTWRARDPCCSSSPAWTEPSPEGFRYIGSRETPPDVQFTPNILPPEESPLIPPTRSVDPVPIGASWQSLPIRFEKVASALLRSLIQPSNGITGIFSIQSALKGPTWRCVLPTPHNLSLQAEPPTTTAHHDPDISSGSDSDPRHCGAEQATSPHRCIPTVTRWSGERFMEAVSNNTIFERPVIIQETFNDSSIHSLTNTLSKLRLEHGPKTIQVHESSCQTSRKISVTEFVNDVEDEIPGLHAVDVPDTRKGNHPAFVFHPRFSLLSVIAARTDDDSEWDRCWSTKHVCTRDSRVGPFVEARGHSWIRILNGCIQYAYVRWEDLSATEQEAFQHDCERWSPRGQEVVVTLVPEAGDDLLYLPFRHIGLIRPQRSCTFTMGVVWDALDASNLEAQVSWGVHHPQRILFPLPEAEQCVCKRLGNLLRERFVDYVDSVAERRQNIHQQILKIFGWAEERGSPRKRRRLESE